MQEEEVCQQQVCTCEHTAAVSPIAGMHYLLSGELEETAAELWATAVSSSQEDHSLS